MTGSYILCCRTRAVLSPQVVASVDLALAYHACTKSGAPIVPGTRTDLRRAFEQSMKACGPPTFPPVCLQGCCSFHVAIIIALLFHQGVSPSLHPVSATWALQAAFEVGMECERKPGSKDNPLITQLQPVLCWWLSEKQEVGSHYLMTDQALHGVGQHSLHKCRLVSDKGRWDVFQAMHQMLVSCCLSSQLMTSYVPECVC